MARPTSLHYTLNAGILDHNTSTARFVLASQGNGEDGKRETPVYSGMELAAFFSSAGTQKKGTPGKIRRGGGDALPPVM